MAKSLRARLSSFFFRVGIMLSVLGKVFRVQRQAPDYLGFFARLGVSPRTSWEVMNETRLEACIGCFQCSLECSAIQNGTAPVGFSPANLVRNQSYAGDESEYLYETWFACDRCGECVVSCPKGIPVHLAVELIKHRRHFVGFRSEG